MKTIDPDDQFSCPNKTLSNRYTKNMIILSYIGTKSLNHYSNQKLRKQLWQKLICSFSSKYTFCNRQFFLKNVCFTFSHHRVHCKTIAESFTLFSCLPWNLISQYFTIFCCCLNRFVVNNFVLVQLLYSYAYMLFLEKLSLRSM